MDAIERNDPIVHRLPENQNKNTSSGLVEVMDAQKAVDAIDVSGQMGQFAQSDEPLEPERTRKIGKCNMRNSLAWDAAFFTSAGFLEPDELSSMIKGVDKGGKHFLPGIEEDIHRSFDSMSTLESESLTMESLEADFFEDIRASIQKSSKASNTTSSSKAAPGETEAQFTSSLKKVDLASNNVMKLKPASMKQTIGLQGQGKSTKQSSGYSQNTQPVARNGRLTPSLPKPREVIARPNPISSAPLKRASLGANKVNMENDKAKGSSVPGKVDPVSKVSSLGGSSRTASKPTPSSKSSSLSSSTATKKLPPRSSSYDRSRGASSANGGSGISPVKSNQRRIDSKTVNPISSSSILKKSSKVLVKKKDQASLMSPKLSSSASPASSISDWSSISSSSTSTVNQRSNASRVSIDTSSPCRSLDSDGPPALDYHDQSNDQISTHENMVKSRPSENLKKASMQSCVLSRPATVKPTGLRMPSPKLGFFDGAKPVDRTPSGSMHAHAGVPPRPKFGARISNPNGGSSKANNTKLQPARTVTAIGNMKLDSKKPASPVPSPKPSNASTKVSSVSGSVKKNLSISARVQKKTDGESCLKAEEVGCEGPVWANDVPDMGLNAEKTKSSGVSESEVNIEKQDNATFKDIKKAPIEGDTRGSSSEKIKLSEEGVEDAIFSLQHLKNNLRSLYEGDEKENAHFEDQVDGLSMHVGVMDSKQEVQKELVGNSVSQIDPRHPDSELSRLKEFFCPGPSNLSGPNPISLSPVTSEIVASTRTPFAVKNSSNEGDLPTRFSIDVVEKTSPFPLESTQMENS